MGLQIGVNRSDGRGWRLGASTAAARWLTGGCREADPSDAVRYLNGNMVMVLYTRRGCHLCESAEDMLAAHVRAGRVEIVDVDGESDLQRRYGTRVPVLAVDGAVVMEGRFDEPELARLLTAPASARDDRVDRSGRRPT